MNASFVYFKWKWLSLKIYPTMHKLEFGEEKKNEVKEARKNSKYSNETDPFTVLGNFFF